MSTDERLQRLLGGEPLAALRLRLRQRYERAAADAPLQGFRIEKLTAAEHTALAALQGRSSRFASSMQVDIAAIDAALRQAGVAESLRAALEQLDGRIAHRTAEREALQSQWAQLRDACAHAELAALLQLPGGLELLKRLAGQNPAAAHFLDKAQLFSSNCQPQDSRVRSWRLRRLATRMRSTTAAQSRRWCWPC